VAFIFSREPGSSNGKRDFLLFPRTSFSVVMKSSNRTADCRNPKQTSLYRNVGQNPGETANAEKLKSALHFSNCEDCWRKFAVQRFTHYTNGINVGSVFVYWTWTYCSTDYLLLPNIDHVLPTYTGTLHIHVDNWTDNEYLRYTQTQHKKCNRGKT